MAKTEFVSKLKRERKKNRVAADGLLSDQEALNLGSLFDIKPAPEGSAGLDKFGKPERLLNIEGQDDDSETILLTFEQQVTFLEPSQAAVPGPVIILVEFGTGSGLSRLEFDLPSPVGGPAPNASSGGLATANIFTPLKSNAVTVVLPASSIRAFARNDAMTGFLNDFNGTTVNSNGGSEAIRQTPAKVRVHAAYGKANMVKQCVRRQYYISAGGDSNLGPVENIVIGLPPFAQKVWFPRTPFDQPLSISLVDYYGLTTATIDIPGDSFGTIDIPPHTGAIIVANPEANPGDFTALSAVFDLGF